MTRHMKLSDAKARLSEVVDDVYTTHEEVEITRNGVPVAVIISFDQLESMRETMDVLSDPEAMAAIREYRDSADEGFVTAAEVQADLDARIARRNAG